MRKLRLIRTIVNASMVLLALGVVFVIVFFIFLPEGKFIDIEQPHWEITSKTLQEELRASLPVPDEPVLLTVEVLEMQLPVHLPLRIIIISIMCGVSVYLLWILRLIQQIIHSVGSGAAFSADNIKRVKAIGTLVVLAPVGEWLVGGLFTFWVRGQLSMNGLRLVNDDGLGWPVFMLGLLIVVLGMAFEQAQKIQEENELTI